MCNEYAREIEMARVIRYMEEMKDVPPFNYDAGRIPNDVAPQRSIKIRDMGVIARLRGDRLVADTMSWAWKTPGGKPVFNFVSEGRAFAGSDRALILATGFYEYTAPKDAKVKLKDQHFFELVTDDWFWIAGIVKQDCFAMLTAAPGPDMTPYHDRQICVLRPEDGTAWLTLFRPERELLHSPPQGTFKVTTLRENGRAVAA